MLRSAGFQTCRIADFQVGSAALRPAGLETRGTADLEVCATLNTYRRPRRPRLGLFFTSYWMSGSSRRGRVCSTKLRMAALGLKHLQKLCSARLWPLRGSGVFGFWRRFGSVTGRCGPAPSPKPCQKPKTLASHRYIISVNALDGGSAHLGWSPAFASPSMRALASL